jgi:hypothetical protein
MNAERKDAESGRRGLFVAAEGAADLPGREQAPDIIDHGAERAGHKAGADQADHEGGFHPVDRSDQMSLVEIKPGKVCHRSVTCESRAPWNSQEQRPSSTYLTTDSTISHAALRRVSFATIAWLESAVGRFTKSNNPYHSALLFAWIDLQRSPRT